MRIALDGFAHVPDKANEKVYVKEIIWNPSRMDGADLSMGAVAGSQQELKLARAYNHMKLVHASMSCFLVDELEF